MPLLSIIIATYNRAHILKQAIESVFAQDFPNFELIVVDDGSSDNTPAFIQPFLSDPRVKYYYQENQGVSAARNYGAARACGEFVLFLDSDDKLKPNYFKTLQFVMEEHPDVVFAGVDFFEGKTFSKTVKANYPHGKFSTEGLFLAGSFAVRRSLFLQVDGYDACITYSENTELAIRLNPLLKKRKFIDSSFLIIYQEISSRTSNSLANVISSTEYMLAKHSDYYETNRHAKWVYHNILAVRYAKAGSVDRAKNHLKEAVKLYPWRLISFLRYIIITIPYLKRRMYGSKTLESVF